MYQYSVDEIEIPLASLTEIEGRPNVPTTTSLSPLKKEPAGLTDFALVESSPPALFEGKTFSWIFDLSIEHFGGSNLGRSSDSFMTSSTDMKSVIEQLLQLERPGTSAGEEFFGQIMMDRFNL